MNSESRKLLTGFGDLLLHPPDPLSPATNTAVLEKELAEFFNTAEAVVVSSGSAAIHCALGILDIAPGDEVLVPALSVVMSVVPVLYQGAKPVFVDCQQNTIDFDYEDLERKLSPKTKAILPVYLWGCSYDLDRLSTFAKKNHLAIVEDACQAHGSLWGTKYLGSWGSLGCFSMRSGKLLSTGEGGFLLTNEARLAGLARAFRSHWVDAKYPSAGHKRLGWNYRLSEIQAMFGQSQLAHLPETLRHRRWQSEYIIQRLRDLPQLRTYPYRSEEQSNYFCPVFLIQKELATRNIAVELSKRGVANSVGSFGLRPAQEWEVFDKYRSRVARISNASHFLDRVLAILLLQNHSVSELDGIVRVVRQVLQST